MGADSKVADAEYVLAWIARKQLVRLTKRDLFEGTKGRFKQVAVLDPVVHLLIELGVTQLAPVYDADGQDRPALRNE